MLTFMDWSVVVMGCLLAVLGSGFRWWEHATVRKGASPRQGVRFSSFPLLMGLGLIAAKGPHLVGAPFAVVMTGDSFSVLLTVTAALVLALQVRRRAGSGPSAG